MKIRRIISIFVVLAAATGVQKTVEAQQYPFRYMYDRYTYMVNPASLGIGEGVGLNLNYSNNCYGALFDNHLVGLGIDAGFMNRNMGLGLVFWQEVQGILRNTNVEVEYAWRAKFTDEHYLSLGLGLGIGYQGQNVSNIHTGDMSDLLIGDSKTAFMGSFGIAYRYKGFRLEASIPSYSMINRDFVPIFALASYNFKLREDFGLKPVVMLDMLRGSSLVDARLGFSYRDHCWIQGGYRTTGEAVVAVGGGGKGFQAGVAFGFNTTSLGDVNKGYMELTVGYRFANAKVYPSGSARNLSQGYETSLSAIRTDLDKLKDDNSKQVSELEKINKSLSTLNEEITKELQSNISEIKEQIQSIQTEDLEVDENRIIDKQYFVVVFSTKTSEDADRIIGRMAQQQVKAEKIKDGKRSFFYIYTSSFDNLQDALKQSEKEKQRGFSNAWILVTH
ncbi:MAG: PorP/SprF family type IX secretion system membrane protein [Bacteroidales bacterium]|jgi:type IX secretion system PorP/SprF family membrane protein|nr:PorP/SprF family type IX secretion system membrane protein [Bacteroidales bacterium]